MLRFIKKFIKAILFNILEIFNLIRLIISNNEEDVIIIYMLPWMQSYKGLFHLRYLVRIIKNNAELKEKKVLFLDLQSGRFLKVLRILNKKKPMNYNIQKNMDKLTSYYKRYHYDYIIRNGDVDEKFLEQVEKWGLDIFYLQPEFWNDLHHFARDDRIIYAFPDIAYYEGWLFKLQNTLEKPVVLLDRLITDCALLTNWESNIEVKKLPETSCVKDIGTECLDALKQRVNGNHASLSYMIDERKALPDHFRSISLEQYVKNKGDNRKVIMLFLHCFTDAVNITDSTANRKNFFCHLLAIKNIMQYAHCEGIDVLLKIHPNWFMYKNDIVFMEKLNNQLPENTVFINDISLSVTQIINKIGENFIPITGRGTVTEELAFSGKQPFNYIENIYTTIGMAAYLNPSDPNFLGGRVTDSSSLKDIALRFTMYKKKRVDADFANYGKRYM